MIRTLLRLLGANHVLLILFIIRNMQLVGAATDLAVFDIGLLGSLAGINKDMVNFSAVGAQKSRRVGIIRFHGRHNNTPFLRTII